MYYSKLTIDRNALANVTRMLQLFTSDNALRIDDVAVTTSKGSDFVFRFSPFPS